MTPTVYRMMVARFRNAHERVVSQWKCLFDAAPALESWVKSGPLQSDQSIQIKATNIPNRDSFLEFICEWKIYFNDMLNAWSLLSEEDKTGLESPTDVYPHPLS